MLSICRLSLLTSSGPQRSRCGQGAAAGNDNTGEDQVLKGGVAINSDTWSKKMEEIHFPANSDIMNGIK